MDVTTRKAAEAAEKARKAAPESLTYLYGVYEKRIFIDGPDRARVRGGIS